MTHQGLARRARRALVALCAIAGVAAVAAPAAPAADAATDSQVLQDKVRLSKVRAHQAALQAIADLAGGNRFAGLIGHDESVNYILSQLAEQDYLDVRTQEFEYDAFVENTPAELVQTAPTSTTYVNGNDFRIMAYSGSGTVTDTAVTALPLPGGNINGCAVGDFAGFTPGNIALVERGACTFRMKTTNAANAGASAILIYNNIPGGLNGTLGAAEGLSAIPSLGLTQALGHQLRAISGLRMSVKTDTDARTLTTRNVIAETKKGDPDNVVFLGAHLDSVTAGPGIHDNGSGSAAILEVARKVQHVDLTNRVRFAWWSAEESGLVGSDNYVDSLSQAERDKIALYLNFDMIGSPNFVRFIYDGDNSTFPAGVGGAQQGPPGSGQIEELFEDYFASRGLPSRPTPFNGRSDYGPFIAAGVGIPAGGLFTGAEGIKTAEEQTVFGGEAGVAYDHCYHAACDTYDNNNDVALDTNTDAIAHATAIYAHSTDSLTAPLAGAAGPQGGSGGGGGLHAGHFDDES